MRGRGQQGHVAQAPEVDAASRPRPCAPEPRWISRGLEQGQGQSPGQAPTSQTGTHGLYLLETPLCVGRSRQAEALQVEPSLGGAEAEGPRTSSGGTSQTDPVEQKGDLRYP